jgi:hypothetical protein
MDDNIKSAFQKVKQDIDFLKQEFVSLKQELRGIIEKLSPKAETKTPAHPPQNPAYPTDIPTHNTTFKPLNTQNMGISIGNGGVPTDKQTNRQTNQHTENTYFGDALEILNSLDNIKKDLRNKFKRITDQEFLVFSTLYTLSEELDFVDYKTLALKLHLTESSIRDYVGRLIRKGIPVEKTKINNKIIQLSVSDKLKKIAPLPVIFQLREL